MLTDGSGGCGCGGVNGGVCVWSPTRHPLILATLTHTSEHEQALATEKWTIRKIGNKCLKK